MPGIDKERILGKDERELDELTCGICQDVFDEPVVTQCCRQTYCKSCIEQWLITKSTCPNDRKLLSVNRLTQPPRFVLNILNNLQVRCENYQYGCEIIKSLELMKEHIKTCKMCTACKGRKIVIKSKDETIEKLKALLKIKEDELNQSFQKNAREIELLKSQLKTKDEVVQRKLLDKNIELDGLNKVINGKNVEIGELNSQLKRKDDELLQSLMNNDKEIEVFKDQLRSKDDEIRKLLLAKSSSSGLNRTVVRNAEGQSKFVWKIIRDKQDIVWEEMVYGTTRTTQGKKESTFFGRLYFNDNLKIMAEIRGVFIKEMDVSFNTKLNDRWYKIGFNTDFECTIEGKSLKVDHFEILTNPNKLKQKWVKSSEQSVPTNAVVCSEEFGQTYYCGRVRVDTQPIPAKIKDGVAHYCDMPGEEQNDFQYLIHEN